jgi:hypothetical protein
MKANEPATLLAEAGRRCPVVLVCGIGRDVFALPGYGWTNVNSDSRHWLREPTTEFLRKPTIMLAGDGSHRLKLWR